MIHRFHYGELPWHGTLLSAITRERAAIPSSALGVANGDAWSGRKGVCAPELETLFRERLNVLTARLDWDIAAWGNVILPGGSVGIHDHGNPGNVWSGSYYLTFGSAILFPRGHVRIDPVPGLMLIWHAPEPHQVEPQPEGYSRVSIAMNASLASLERQQEGR